MPRAAPHSQTLHHAALPAASALQVAREDHFAAVKNAPGSSTDSPDTARAALLAQGARWVAAAGGQLAGGCEGMEVSPLVSYAGEGLAELVEGATLQVCVCVCVDQGGGVLVCTCATGAVR
jgi:hypothetical protein